MNAVQDFADLHDATLDGLSLDWEAGLLRFGIRLESYQVTHLELRAIEVKRLSCPRREEWGRSSYVNEVRGPVVINEGGGRLEIEMQSGDVIEIEAREVLLLPK